MNKIITRITFLFASTIMVWGNTNIRTSIKDLYYRGSCEEAGGVTFSVNGDDYAYITPDAPRFIRIRLDHNARLCQSLVGNSGTLTFNETTTEWEYDAADLNTPIYLAMRLEGGPLYPDGTCNTLVAQPETISIVRWLEEEGELWIRVQSSSSSWILNTSTGETVPPSMENGTVAWTFGITARDTHTSNVPLFTKNLSNLPGNTRLSTWDDSTDLTPAITTLFCVDLTQSNLMAMPVSDNILAFDHTFFKDTNQGWGDMDFDGSVNRTLTPEFSLKYSPPNGPIDKGTQPFVNSPSNDSIARGFDHECSEWMIPTETSTPVTKRLCTVSNAFSDEDWGLVCMENEILIRISCEEHIQGKWFYGSSCVLANTTDSNWGFALHSDVLPTPYGFFSDGTPVYLEIPTSAINPPVSTMGSYFVSNQTHSANFIWDISEHGPYFLGKANQVMWMGNDDYGSTSILLHAEVSQYVSNGPDHVHLHTETYLTNRDHIEYLEPFNGVEQGESCLPSMMMIDENYWDFGDFVPCSGDPVSIHYSYFPKLVENDFWAGLVLSNSGIRDFTGDGDLIGSIYDAEGTKWKVTFPALPVNSMQSWLLTAGEEGVGFYGVYHNPMTRGKVLIPVTLNEEKIFANTQMSMFITGTHHTEYAHKTTGGELNGYVILGKGTQIESSYLAVQAPTPKTETNTPKTNHGTFSRQVMEILKMRQKKPIR